MALFKKGFEAARQEKKRQEEVREQIGKRLFRFFLTGDGAEAKVRFLTEEPINFMEHTVKVYKNGKERYDNFLCSGDDNCPYCEEGSKASFKGAFLIWDYSEFEVKDNNGKKKTVGRLPLNKLYRKEATLLKDYVSSNDPEVQDSVPMFDVETP